MQYDEDAYTPTSGAAGFIATQMVGDGKLSDEEIDMIGGKRVLLNVGSVIGGSRNSFSLFDNVNDDLPLSRLTGRYVGLSITIGAESRVITSYVVANPGANPAIVVSPDFVALPTSGATYEIYSPTKEYLLFGVSFTGLTDNVEEPIYRLYMRSSFPYVDTAYGQGMLSDTGAAVGACYAGAYQDCPASWAYFISPGRIDTAEFGFAAGSPGAVDDCNRIVTDVNPNYCLVRHNSLVSRARGYRYVEACCALFVVGMHLFHAFKLADTFRSCCANLREIQGHFYDSITFVQASQTQRCYISGACAVGEPIGKGVRLMQVSLYTREYDPAP